MGRKVFLILILVALAALAVVNIRIGKTNQTLTKSPPGGEQVNAILPVEASQLTSVDSPDGTKKLSMKTSKKSGQVTYSFSVSEREIFTATVDSSTTFSIPLNTFSPDNKYVFLKEVGPSGASFFALSATASPNDQNDQTSNITNLFLAKYPDLKIGDVTGWGGINLIVINSVNSDGSTGPSFWFGMPGHSLTQLSTRF